MTRSGAASAASSTARPPNDVPTSAAEPSNVLEHVVAERKLARPLRLGAESGEVRRHHFVLPSKQRPDGVPFAGIRHARVHEDDVDNNIITAGRYPSAGSCSAS